MIFFKFELENENVIIYALLKIPADKAFFTVEVKKSSHQILC